MECAKILLHPQQFEELDKYIKGKWAMGSQSEEEEQDEEEEEDEEDDDDEDEDEEGDDE